MARSSTRCRGSSSDWRDQRRQLQLALDLSAKGTATKPRAVNAMNYFAAAIQGKPFSLVSSYIDQNDASSLQATYAAIQKAWQPPNWN